MKNHHITLKTAFVVLVLPLLTSFVLPRINETVLASDHFPLGNDGGGICAKIIEPWGYTCEEHKVWLFQMC